MCVRLNKDLWLGEIDRATLPAPYGTCLLSSHLPEHSTFLGSWWCNIEHRMYFALNKMKSAKFRLLCLKIPQLEGTTGHTFKHSQSRASSLQVCLCPLHCQLASTPGRESKRAREGKREVCIFELLEKILNYGSSHFYCSTHDNVPNQSSVSEGALVGSFLAIRASISKEPRQGRWLMTANSWESENIRVGEREHFNSNWYEKIPQKQNKPIFPILT